MQEADACRKLTHAGSTHNRTLSGSPLPTIFFCLERETFVHNSWGNSAHQRLQKNENNNGRLQLAYHLRSRFVFPVHTKD